MEQLTRLSPQEAEETAARLADCFAQRLCEELGSRAGVWERSDPPVVFWYDQAGWRNTAQLVTYLAPTEQHPARPLLLRAAINFFDVSALDLLPAHVGPEAASVARRGWSLELTARPEEITDLAPWIASFSAAQAARDPALLSAPAHPLRCRPEAGLACNYAWTWTAWRAVGLVMQQIEADRREATRTRAPARS
jgi:hypothetical protein